MALCCIYQLLLSYLLFLWALFVVYAVYVITYSIMVPPLKSPLTSVVSILDAHVYAYEFEALGFSVHGLCPSLGHILYKLSQNGGVFLLDNTLLLETTCRRCTHVCK